MIVIWRKLQHLNVSTRDYFQTPTGMNEASTVSNIIFYINPKDLPIQTIHHVHIHL